jgi:[ribosomal protein S5]-alanine N-acetyltransferase
MQRPEDALHTGARSARRRPTPERQAASRSAAVNLRRPGIRHADQFISAVRRSRALHKGLVSPPADLDAYERYLKSLRKSTHVGFLVVPEGGEEIAGVVNVSEIVRGAFQSAYLGYYAFEPFAGKGLMFRGIRKVIRHCFGSLKLHRLEANIQPENLRSIALVRRLGFEREGYSPRYLKICGRWRDHERWALLSERGGKGHG